MSLPLSSPVQPYGIHRVTAPSDLSSGEPFSVTGYPTLVLEQIKPALSGELVTGCGAGTRSFAKASAVTASSGDTAYWHVANQTVVVASGAGIITLGKFRGAAVSGITSCNVELNGV